MHHQCEEEFAELRRRAEALLGGRFEDEGAVDESFTTLPELIHELEVHQVELEMQNRELRLTEQRLEASEKKYADLYNFAPVGYFTFNRKGMILEGNLTGASLLGVDRLHLIGKPFPAFCTPESADRFYLHVRRVLKTRHSETCELTLKRQDGVPFAAQLESVAAEEGAFSLCRSALSNITERKRAEDLSLRQGEQLMENDQRKNEFLSMMAHELRNPLAPIRNAVQILLLGAADERSVKRQGEMIDRQVSQMARLLDDLLDISRITQGKITLQRERLDLRDVVSRALETSMSFVKEHGHHLHYDPLSEPLWLEGDGARLEQIICNLLNNSIKYTETGGQIWVALEREASDEDPPAPEAVLRIRDSGVGIAPEMLSRVFDLFTQAERSLDRSQGGLGIGLSLVRRLVELHGGTIVAHSAGLGQGSEFVVHLPLRPESGAPSTDPKRPEATAIGPNAIVEKGAARKILVVDDNVDETNSLGELLERWGYSVRRAYDGAAVLAAALEFQPDVVLLDLGLPGLSGCELAPLLRAQSSLAGAAIIALTGYGQAEDRRLSLASGFDDHFTKPVDLDRLQLLLKKQPAR